MEALIGLFFLCLVIWAMAESNRNKTPAAAQQPPQDPVQALFNRIRVDTTVYADSSVWYTIREYYTLDTMYGPARADKYIVASGKSEHWHHIDFCAEHNVVNVPKEDCIYQFATIEEVRSALSKFLKRELASIPVYKKSENIENFLKTQDIDTAFGLTKPVDSNQMVEDILARDLKSQPLESSSS